ncbi:MAG: SCO family protein [Sphingobacteriales bacterium]|nr:MAG: SCO family protein [Sphingobacteriales bacterium]
MRVLRRFIPYLILLLPVIAILILRQGKNVYQKLPHIGNYKGLKPNGDTIFHAIPEFSLTDQYGKAFGSNDLKGKTYVANFIFTRCPNICPEMTKNLTVIKNEFKNWKDFRMISMTLDPKFDSPKVLNAFADKYEVNNGNWHFLTGSHDSIYWLMNQEGFLIVKPLPSEDPAQFQHSEVVALIDKDGYIRGHYNGTDLKDVERLKDEIKLLYHSYAEEKSAKR